MQKFRYRSIGIADILFSRSDNGLVAVDLDPAREAELVKYRGALARTNGALVRLAAVPFGAALSHLANCKHPRIWSTAMAWE